REAVAHGVELARDRLGSVALTEQSMENRSLDACGVERRVQLRGVQKVDERLTMVAAPDALTRHELAVRLVRRRPGRDAHPGGESRIHERCEASDGLLPNAFHGSGRVGRRAAR